MSENASGQIDTVMTEERLFTPSDEFASKSAIGWRAAAATRYQAP